VMLGECRDEKPAGEIGDHSYVAYLLVDGVSSSGSADPIPGRAMFGSLPP